MGVTSNAQRSTEVFPEESLMLPSPGCGLSMAGACSQ